MSKNQTNSNNSTNDHEFITKRFGLGKFTKSSSYWQSSFSSSQKFPESESSWNSDQVSNFSSSYKSSQYTSDDGGMTINELMTLRF